MTAFSIATTADQQLALELSGVLTRHYPGHPWGVHVDSRAGIATIQNFALAERSGYVLHLSDLKNHDAVSRQVIEAGGEILERFDVKRGTADRDQLAQLAPRAVFN